MEEYLPVGKQFEDYKSLEAELEKLQKMTFTNLRKKDSHTLKSKKASGKCMEYKDELVYHDVQYVCKHYGTYRSNKKTGERTTVSTKKKCPFTIKFVANKDGQSLQCTSIKDEHNHQLTEEYFLDDHTQRKLNNETKQEILTALKRRADRKVLADDIAELTGKRVILKDIHNIAREFRKLDKSDTVAGLTEYLKENYPSLETEYVINDSNTVTGIFIQDAEMKSSFSRFPEVILLDATHKTNNLQMPFYGMMCVDGNAASQLVCVFLVQTEEEETLRDMIQVFKRKNPNWTKIQVAVTDKDMTERNVIKSEIQQVQMQICLFHVLRTFNREVNMEKMGITSAERDTLKSLIQECVYSVSEEDYIEKYEAFKEAANDKVMDYYNRNWHSIKEEWVEGLKSKQLNLQTRTNNRLESFFGHLKSCTNVRGSLQDIITGFLKFVRQLRRERAHKMTRATTTISTVPLDTQEEKNFKEFCTPYAFKFVQSQLKLVDKVPMTEDGKVNSRSGIRNTTEYGCDCTTYTSMNLPCRHIFAVLKYKEEDLFCPTLVNKRWTMLTFMQPIVYQLLQIDVSQPKLPVQEEPSFPTMRNCSNYK